MEVIEIDKISKFLNGIGRAKVYDDQRKLVKIIEGEFKNGLMDGFGRHFDD